MSILTNNVAHRLPSGGEFQGRNGDCVEYSFMVARAAAVISAACDGAELNRLTGEAISAGEAGPSGAMTNANLAWLCSKEGVTYEQIAGGDWHSYIERWAGVQPIVMGFSNGQALPGNEPNVFGHAVAVLDHDWQAQTYTIANGDSTNGRAGQFDVVPIGALFAAQPTQTTRLILNAQLSVILADLEDMQARIADALAQLKSLPA